MKNKAISSSDKVGSMGRDTRKRPVYKQWTKSQMNQVLHAITTSKMSIRNAIQFPHQLWATESVGMYNVEL